MTDIQRQIGNLAQNNYYYVEMSGLPKKLSDHLTGKYGETFGDISRFTHRLGFLCSEASLPTSAYATAETKGDFIGVTQEFAHTRIYTDLDMTFYVDSNYKVLRYFEGWMDYIGGGSEVDIDKTLNGNAYRRMNYPNDYKMNSMKIYKFERDYKNQIKYTFVNLFPKSLGAVSVAYGASEILKVSVSFNFDRYVVNNDRILTPQDYADAASKAFTQPLDLDYGVDYSPFSPTFNAFQQQANFETIPIKPSTPGYQGAKKPWE